MDQHDRGGAFNAPLHSRFNNVYSVHISPLYHERDLMLPDGKPAPPPGFRVRRFWTEAEPPDPTTLHNALTHTDLRHACVLSPIIPTVVSHAIVPLPDS